MRETLHPQCATVVHDDHRGEKAGASHTLAIGVGLGSGARRRRGGQSGGGGLASGFSGGLSGRLGLASGFFLRGALALAPFGVPTP